MGMPITRAECSGVSRPCPYSQCRFHLDAGGSYSCALDFADDVAERPSRVATYEEVGRAMGVSEAYVRQVEQRALTRLALYCNAEAA